MLNKRITLHLIPILLLIYTLWIIGSIIFDPEQRFFSKYYSEANFKTLERLYDTSQYRQKSPTSLIADDVVFRYASGAYVKGVDPILINSEHTPLGKYLIGASLILFQTDGPVILLSALLSLFALWLVGRELFKNSVWALVPVVLWVSEALFQDQLRVTPLLDIIQLPWILLSLYGFLKRKYFYTAIFLGLAAATKSVVPTILLVGTYFIFWSIKKQIHDFLRFAPWLLVSFCIFALSYIRTFFNGYSMWDFLGFQKWILLYQQSKLIFPFSFWRLVLFNQWQTWWGEMKLMSVDDWHWTWPILVIVPFVILIKSQKKIADGVLLLLIWVFVYEAFLSTGIVTTRFLLPLLPILYILAVHLIRGLVPKS